MADNDETPQAADTSTIFLTEEIAAKAFTSWRAKAAADPDTFSDRDDDPECYGDAKYFFWLCEQVA